MFSRLLKYGMFFIVPGIVLFFSILFKIAIGPYWLSTNFDPSYLYLCNGLRILKGVALNDANHPGTPVQMLCSAVCWLFNIGSSPEDAVVHVVTNPEFYFWIVFLILAMFSFMTSLGLAVYVFRKTNDKLAAVLTQVQVLSFLVMKAREAVEPVLPVIANVSPEPMLISVINLFNICLLMAYFAKTSKDILLATVCWGFVCGLGGAVKMTFIPLIAVGLIILPWKNKVLLLAVSAASFFVWTLPALSRYPLIFGSVSSFFINKGSYTFNGPGMPGGVFNPYVYLLNWKNIILAHPILMGIILAALLMVLGKIIAKKWDKASFYILAIVAGILVQFSAVAKFPGEHYLLPGLGMFGVLAAFFCLQGSPKLILIRRAIFAIILVFIFVKSWQAWEYWSHVSNFSNGIQGFHEYVHNKYKDFVFVKSYRSSGPDEALHFGDGWNGETQLGKELSQVYPNSYFLDTHIVSFKDRALANDLMSGSNGVIFQRDDSYDFKADLMSRPFFVRLLEKGPFESVYLLTGTTEKQSVMFFIAAAMALQAGEYKKARVCALKAKELHYEPISDVDGLIQKMNLLHQG